MAERDSAKDINFYEFESTNVMTGGTDQQRYLLYQLKNSIQSY